MVLVDSSTSYSELEEECSEKLSSEQEKNSKDCSEVFVIGKFKQVLGIYNSAVHEKKHFAIQRHRTDLVLPLH